MAKIDGGELFCRVLKKNNVDTVFTLHGGHLDAIFLANVQNQHGISFVDFRHEASAGHAAEGYARNTGNVGVAMATAGPGFTNLVTPITNAWLDCTPTVFIAGGPPLREAEMNPLQGGIDQVAMVAPVTKWAAQVTQTHLIVPMLEQCLRIATSGRPGPVFLEIPVDVLFDQIDDDVTLSDSVMPDPTMAAAPAPAAISKAVAMLRQARRPVLCAGGGALFSQCGDALREFVEKTGLPVYTNNKAHGIIPAAHPLSCGKIANMAAMKSDGGERPDLIIMLGARFGLFTGGDTDAMIPDDAQVIQIDLEPKEFGRVREVDLGIPADCRVTLQALSTAFDQEPWQATEQDWRTRAEVTSRWHCDSYAEVLDTNREKIHPYFLGNAVCEAVGDDAIFVSDGGNTNNWTELNAEKQVQHPGNFLAFGYLGCLGVGPGMAIGAQYANPGKPVIFFTGDGALGLNLPEWDTMVRHNLPIVTVVANNSGWGMSFQSQDLTWPKGTGRVVTDLNPNRYDLIAEAFGCHGELVTKPSELLPALDRALSAGKPAVLNVMIDPEPVSPQLQTYIALETAGDEIILPYYSNLKTGK